MTNTKPNPETIRPRPDWVFVKPDDEDARETESGLLKPDNLEQEKKSYGTILAVGSKVGDLVKGERVIYGTYAGEALTIDEIEYKLLHNDDVIATF